MADNSSACGGGEDQFSIDINWGYVMWVGWVVVDWHGRPRDEMLHRVLGLGANLTYILLNESIKLDLIRVGMASAYL